MCSMEITDFSLSGYKYGLRVKFFSAIVDKFPKVRGNGDVIMLRKIKVSLTQSVLRLEAVGMSKRLV